MMIHVLTFLSESSFSSPVPHSNMNALENRGGHTANHEVGHECQCVLIEKDKKREGKRRYEKIRKRIRRI